MGGWQTRKGDLSFAFVGAAGAGAGIRSVADTKCTRPGGVHSVTQYGGLLNYGWATAPGPPAFWMSRCFRFSIEGNTISMRPWEKWLTCAISQHLPRSIIRAHAGEFLRLSTVRFLRYWTGTGSQHGSVVFTIHAVLTTLGGAIGLSRLWQKTVFPSCRLIPAAADTFSLAVLHHPRGVSLPPGGRSPAYDSGRVWGVCFPCQLAPRLSRYTARPSWGSLCFYAWAWWGWWLAVIHAIGSLAKHQIWDFWPLPSLPDAAYARLLGDRLALPPS